MPKKPKEKAKVYFRGLHGLRFFAAMLVVFSHIELMKDYHGYPNLYHFIRLERLPRSESGKLRRQALDQAFVRWLSSGQAQAGLVDPLPTPEPALRGRGHAQR
jgi:hypothetical protein